MISWCRLRRIQPPPQKKKHHSMQSVSYNLPYLSLILPSFFVAENIEWCIEEQAFSLSYDLAPPPPPPNLPSATCLSFCLPVCLRSSLLTGMGEMGRGWERSQIIRRRISLVLCKSFNTLCCWAYLCKLGRWEGGGRGAKSYDGE